MRVQDIPAVDVEVLDSLLRLLVADALALEVPLRRIQDLLVHGEAALVLEVLEPLLDLLARLLLVPLVVHAGRAGELVGEEPEQPLEVRGHQDVHCGAQGLAHAVLVRLDAVLRQAALGLAPVHGVLLVVPAAPEAVEDVVLVGRDDELINREAHALGEVAGEDVAEVAGRDDEADLVGGVVGGALLEGEVGFEVVGCLGQDAGPVDGVDGAELLGCVDFGVCEEGFYGVLGRLALAEMKNVVLLPGNRQRCPLLPNCGRSHRERWSSGPPGQG